MVFTGERLVPGAVDADLETEHKVRYQFAAQFVAGKTVLDAACGTGYGSAILAETAKSVDGLDVSQEAIDYAEENYGNPRIHFSCGSIAQLPYPDDTFDLYVSFETLEHVDEETQNGFLSEALRVLKQDGILIISTPNKNVYDKRGENEFHVRELDYPEFHDFLHSAFSNIRFLSQQWELSMILAEDGMADAKLHSDMPAEKAEYLIAVCSNAPIPTFSAQIAMKDSGSYRKVLDWAVGNQEQIEARNAHIAILDKEIESDRTAIQDRDRMLSEQKRTLDRKIAELTKNCEDLQTDLKEQQETYAERIAKLETERNAEIAHAKELDAEIAVLQQTVRNKEGHIELLLESDRELERIKGPYENARMELDVIKGSRTWKLAQRFAKIAGAVIPRGSKRRVVLKLLREILRHPGAYLKKCTPSHIGRFVRTLHQEGASGASGLIDEFNQVHCLADVTTSMVLETTEPVKEGKSIGEYEKLIVPQWKEPAVSIVIPVYNQFDYTYLCVKSILENSEKTKYEIIIADDCSSDLTTQIDQVISGLHVIHNQRNLRFLLNCNNAAKTAKGQYILFLNNDTQVQKNWLQPLVDLIESSDEIGMVGSKLVYPDGRLQEAGGILWKDGSAWNFGNKDNPDLPQYNYVKEADYISGAAIMILRELWKKIGGFDERFVPAYCEDSDLAFEVRKHGYKVLYQPQSVVVHFEGVSNGTDTSSGQKAYQIENQKKFFEKWRNVLEAEHYPNGENVFAARDRSGKKKTVLIIDHYIPQYDKDAGSRTMDNFIRVLADMGYNLKFIGDNFYYDPQYAPHYEQMGVEMLCGNYYYNHWKEWIKANAASLDYVLLSRPHISIKYIDFLRENTKARLIYYVQDLHYLREEREYEITHDPECLKVAKEVKKQEFYLMNHSDFVLTPSTVEREIINQEIPGNKAEAIPIYCYDQFRSDKLDLADKKDIIFVGGFAHRPNEDGVLWFAENVWPTVEKNLPGSRWIVIGSNPTEKVRALEKDNVVITGYVSDEELEKYYNNSRLCVIPLRYGAGVKGKTLEALYHRIPIVSTSVGIEGLQGIEEFIKPADTAEAFAAQVIAVFNDPEGSARKAEKYHTYLQKNNSFEAIAGIFQEAFARKGQQQ